jgi:hypothetical protein
MLVKFHTDPNLYKFMHLTHLHKYVEVQHRMLTCKQKETGISVCAKRHIYYDVQKV